MLNNKNINLERGNMIYFIGGTKFREFKYFEILNKFREEKQNISESFFDAELKEDGIFLEKVSTNSIFSAKELVVLKRAQKIKKFEAFLKHIADLNIMNKQIVIDYEKEDGKLNNELKKTLDELEKDKKIKSFLFLKNEDIEIQNYIMLELKINKKEASSLLEMIGQNPFKVRNEVKKIKIFLNGEKFDLKKIKNIISLEKEYKIYEMTREILSDKANKILLYLEQTKEYMGVLYSLYSELEILYKIKMMKNDGKKFSSNYNTFKTQFEKVKEAFKVNNRIPNSYVIFKKLELEKNYSLKNLKNLVYRSWEIENNIKMGKIEMNTGVEKLIMEISSLYQKS